MITDTDEAKTEILQNRRLTAEERSTRRMLRHKSKKIKPVVVQAPRPTHGTTLIGDVHGKWAEYGAIVHMTKGPTIQLGDMGFGFSECRKGTQLPGTNKDRFVRGNHDSPDIAREHPRYLGDIGYHAPVFFISGGFSIDWFNRKLGVSWWEGEQLPEVQLESAIQLYQETKPRIVISHDAPTSAAETLLNLKLAESGSSMYGGGGYMQGYYGAKLEGVAFSRMSKAMERMLQIHQPEQWIFGHFHCTEDFQVKNYDTRFHILGELAHRKFDFQLEDNDSISVMPDGTYVSSREDFAA